MLLKTLLFLLLLVTASALPQEPEDDYDYPEEEESPPAEFLVEPQHLKAKQGGTVTIPCDYNDNFPYVLIIKKTETSYQKEALLFVGAIQIRRNHRFKIKGHYMEISNLRRGDAGTYICILDSKPAAQVRHVLEVEYSPKITSKTKEEYVHKGDSVKLECVAEGNPVPTITWSKQEGRLPSSAMEEEGSSITMTNIDRHVGGSYVCTADNGIGDTASEVISVNVEYPPEIITERDMVLGSINGTVELECNIDARPAPTVFWSKDGHMLLSDSHIDFQEQSALQHSISAIRHSIKINSFTKDDFGEYICHAKNKYGEAMATISLSGMEIMTQQMTIGGEIEAGVIGIFLVLLLAFLYTNHGQS